MIQLKRREFLLGCAGSGLVLTGCAGGRSSGASTWADRAGVQLYTFHQQMQEDMAPVFSAVASVGYKEVEFVGAYIKQPAKQIRAMLEAEGLTVPSGHVDYTVCRDEDAFKQAIEDANALGYENLIIPYLTEETRPTTDAYRRIAGEFNVWGELCRDAGIQFTYHNHDFEFQQLQNEMPMDILMTETEADLVAFELDLCWIEFAGRSAIEYINAHPGRFPLFHVKDFNEDRELCPVGQGVVDFVEIFKHAETAGLRHAYVEHDNPDDALASITESYRYLKAANIKMPPLSAVGGT